MNGLKTAYATAYHHLKLLVKSGRIGEVVSVESTCTSMAESPIGRRGDEWGGVYSWGPTAVLPIFQILGCKFEEYAVSSMLYGTKSPADLFSKVDFYYASAVASARVGVGVKSEGDLVIAGTKGYVYVPAPWWKTDYFEIRYENPADNRRFFYQLVGDGIRDELSTFAGAITGNHLEEIRVSRECSSAMVNVIEQCFEGNRARLVKRSDLASKPVSS